MTLVSVVMPSFQQAAFLNQAVESVLSQEGVEVELLVLDAGSTDGSRELLQKLQRSHGDRLCLVFEPDMGQADAVNRGIDRARGQILGWLNSDDYLLPGALNRVVETMGIGEAPAWLYGRAMIVDEKARPTAKGIEGYKRWRGRRFSYFKLLTENFIPQMATFWNRQMWSRVGGLNTELDLDMDYDLWLRFARIAPPTVLPVDLAAFRVHSGAKGTRRTVEQLRAARETARRHSAGLGWRGRAALLLHSVLSARTRFIYSWTKP